MPHRLKWISRRLLTYMHENWRNAAKGASKTVSGRLLCYLYGTAPQSRAKLRTACLKTLEQLTEINFMSGYETRVAKVKDGTL
ncbi:hypothetical protein [Ferrimonas kyonanensis]|uniref:hypothetical protein n=1 Tax=Ferrimonas kyonanensis TaxID=364763 RepID=UPI00040B06A8|nr:hypothetical protein [Ferrimonas kyonanensis]